jgi:hypothetical protein
MALANSLRDGERWGCGLTTKTATNVPILEVSIEHTDANSGVTNAMTLPFTATDACHIAPKKVL